MTFREPCHDIPRSDQECSATGPVWPIDLPEALAQDSSALTA